MPRPVGAASIGTWPMPLSSSDGRGGGAQVVPAHVIHGLTGGELVGVDFARDYSGVPTPELL